MCQERLRGFLRYCLHAKLIDQVPKLSPIKVAESPTLPLTDGQYKKLLEAVLGCIWSVRGGLFFEQGHLAGAADTAT